MADIAEEHPALKSDGHNVVLSGDANEPENGQKELDEANDEPVLEADEPLPSGFGHVSKDCSEEELQGWSQVLSQWKDNMAERPKLLSQLVRRGIPEALRGEVWQMLAKCYNDEELIAAYAILMTKDCRHDVYVARDVSRTFAVHPFFRGTNSAGQESLGRVCRAYAIFDEEIGYCQGMSFIVAALLLHMPEEQAFCVLVKIMQEYGLRNMFKVGFEELQLRFFQLEKLIGDHLPNLYIHFANNGIEAHMYASQWFLTMFSSKFPLYVVYSILDIYLLDGFPTMFQVALALLQLSEKDMLKQDFEGVMKYFRVYLPKKYRDVNDARLLLQTANRRSVTKQLKNYEAEYRQLSEQDKQRGDTVQRLQKENRRLLLSNMQLEQHLDDMARELIGSKIELDTSLILVRTK
ncbi:Rab GTPase-activating protein 1 [Halotydeus destructor]|nr:Rab GTPase-activating protein 1 [Halotydeus destructor]